MRYSMNEIDRTSPESHVCRRQTGRRAIGGSAIGMCNRIRRLDLGFGGLDLRRVVGVVHARSIARILQLNEFGFDLCATGWFVLCAKVVRGNARTSVAAMTQANDFMMPTSLVRFKSASLNMSEASIHLVFR